MSLACSKLSLALFIHTLTPITKDRWLATVVEAVVGVWAAVTLFGTAFQCSVPRTWDIWNGKCFSIVSEAYLPPPKPTTFPPTPRIQIILIATRRASTVGMALFCRRLEHLDRSLARGSGGRSGFPDPNNSEASHNVCGYLPTPALVSVPVPVWHYPPPDFSKRKRELETHAPRTL